MRALFFDNDIRRILAVKALSKVDKLAALRRFAPVRYAVVPEPELPNGRWLKVRNKSCGLCGTDIHLILMDLDPLSFPAALPGLQRKFLGHELLGEVLEVGDDVGDFAPGQRVVQRIDWPSCFQLEIDPPCARCAEGSYMLCENLGKRPMPIVNVGGGFSPRMVMHRSQPFKVPDELSDERAQLIEPTASALHGVLRRPPRPGEKLLVIGAGTIGLLCLACARALEPEAEVYVLARHKFQREAARRMGATAVLSDDNGLLRKAAGLTDGAHHRGMFGNQILLGGFDAVYDSVGNDHTLQSSLRLARAGGDVVLVGINMTPGKFDYTPIWNQEITLHGINSHAVEADGRNTFERAAELLADPRFPAEGLITHRLPMKRWSDAVKLFLDKGRSGAIKIVLEH
ncbi:MAG: zinc-binding dehydrogenase [Candidatus Alcyoniella australis]|nr:zinc-binding dehydrogenase [Candidatus Alcyoniella australis]